MKTETVTAVLKRIELVHIFVIIPSIRILVPVVNGLTINAGDDTGVIFGFVAAFDFQRIDTGR